MGSRITNPACGTSKRCCYRALCAASRLESGLAMRILMIGDVVGRPGRAILEERLPRLKQEFRADFVVVNGENAAGGVGITPEIADALLNAGTDVITLGNHAWNKREIYSYLDRQARILRPANYPPGVPGRGWGAYVCKGSPVGVVALQGRVFMDLVDDPFRAIDAILEELRPQCKVIFVDFHAEATSEKQTFARYVDGRVSAVVGTHTHVQTADERIFPKGTAYLSDVGMTGPIESIIGMRYDSVIARSTTALPTRFEVADGDAQICGVVIEANLSTGKALSIERLQVPSYCTRVERGDE